MNDNLKPGQKVVSLATAFRSTGFLSGALVTALCVWMITRDVLATGMALLVGAISGHLIATVISIFVYRTKDGTIPVVKTGASAIPTVLKATLPSALVVGAILPVAVAFVMHAAVASLIGYGLGVALVSGVLLALLSALL